MKHELTAERLREVLNYDPNTGVFTWRISKGPSRSGSVAGSINKTGYWHLRIDGGTYQAHRVAWLYQFGKWPASDIDHINRTKNDNRIANLREITASQNQQNTGARKNNPTGFKGVSLHKQRNQWRAQIRVNNRNKYLGLFKSPEDAFAAYQAEAAKHHTHNPSVQEAA